MTELKESEVKKGFPVSIVFERSITGQNGPYCLFKIIFDNGDKGVFFAPKETQDIFILGVETEYIKKEEHNGNYINYKFSPVKAARQFPGKAFIKNSGPENKRVALHGAISLAIAGKIELIKIKEFAESFMNFLNE